MGIRASVVFKTSFQKLSVETKLLYVYLMTHPQLNTVGVVQINPEVSAIEVGLKPQVFRTATQDLVNKGEIKVMREGGTIYFLLLNHYATHANGNGTFKKAEGDLKSYSPEVREWVEQFINIHDKVVAFIEPTAEDVTAYGISVGHVVDGEQVVEYYRRQAEIYRKKDWVDSRGRQVIDWKGKIRKVWCRDSNKLKRQDDAPVGFEYFHINYGGRIIYPDYWRGGFPQSREGLVITEELRQEYERQQYRK